MTIRSHNFTIQKTINERQNKIYLQNQNQNQNGFKEESG